MPWCSNYKCMVSPQCGFSHELKEWFSKQKPCCSDCNCKVSLQCGFSHVLTDYCSVHKPYCSDCNCKAYLHCGLSHVSHDDISKLKLCCNDCNYMASLLCALTDDKLATFTIEMLNTKSALEWFQLSLSVRLASAGPISFSTMGIPDITDKSLVILYELTSEILKSW